MGRWWVLALCPLVIVGLDRAALTFHGPEGASPWYPALGWALAMGVWFGWRAVAPVFVGFLAAMVLVWSVSWGALALYDALVKTVVGVAMGRVLARDRTVMDLSWSLRSVLRFLKLAFATAAVTSLLNNLPSLVAAAGRIRWDRLAVWLAGDFVGVFIFTPAFLLLLACCQHRGRAWRGRFSDVAEFASYLVLSGGVVAMVLLTPWGWHYNLLFLCFVVIIAAALRLGFLGAALLVAALDAAILLVVGVTPAESIMRADMRRLYVLQLLLATVAGSGFILASTIDDYRRMRTVLATHRDRLSELVAERTRRLADEVKERRRAERALADSHRLLELQLDDRERALLAAKREAEEANRAKSRFLQNVSHELRTPLNAILGFGGMILNGIHGPVRPAVYGEYVRHIVEAGEHLRDLVNRLLDVERSDDVSAFSCTAVDPREIVANSIRLMAPHAAGRRVELEMVCADDLPMVWGDAARLRQIVINLLDNAIKYGPAGGRVRVVLHRSCETRQGGNDADQDSGSAQAWVDLRVEDEGPGVPERLRERIFERFGRAHDADIADAPAGLGLGLYLVRRMVEAMGGAVWVEDAPSGGACFIVRLKIASA